MKANLLIHFSEESIACKKYGFHISHTTVHKNGPLIHVWIYWNAPLNDGYFLFKSPKLEYGRIIFPHFNQKHKQKKFYIDLTLKDAHVSNKHYTFDRINKLGATCSKDGANFYFEIDKPSKEIMENKNGLTWFQNIEIGK